MTVFFERHNKNLFLKQNEENLSEKEKNSN